jgi:hypothetical protein
MIAVSTVIWRARRASYRHCCLAAIVYLPLFKFASLLFSLPTAIRGPVERPPCILQRPFAIAGPLHGAPPRVRAFALTGAVTVIVLFVSDVNVY